MARLVTPFAFEHIAEGLNPEHYLVLRDRVLIEVNNPVGCVSAVNTTKPIKLKLLKSDNQGVLLRNYSKKYTTYEKLVWVVDWDNPVYTFNFVQSVKICSIYISAYFGSPTYLFWMTPSDLAIQNFPFNKQTVMYARGNHFRFRGYGSGYWATWIELAGFN
jgi:hypothetical protein